MKRLAPSILSAEFFSPGRADRIYRKSGAHLIHVDVMDGHFRCPISVLEAPL